MKNRIKPEIITTRTALCELVGRMSAEPLIAVDVEADSLHHYQEKVCLIQISMPKESVIIDPLLLPDLSPLSKIMDNRSIRKIFHGADYDIRSLHRDFGIVVHNLFDTMIACQFLGEKEVGLAAVLYKRFGVELDKRYQKADWSLRPLSNEMIEYAVRDTSLLIDLYGMLKKELADRKRLTWVEEESELLAGVRSNPRDQEPLFIRFKGASRMDRRCLAVLEELLRFRDNTAKALDLPPFKVLGSDTVRFLAEKMPRHAGDLEGIPGLSPKLIKRFGRGILEATAKGVAIPQELLPFYPSTSRFIREKRKGEMLRSLKQWREARAGELGIEAGILVNNGILEEVADAALHGKDKGIGEISLKHWQNEAFGRELRKFANDLICSA